MHRPSALGVLIVAAAAAANPRALPFTYPTDSLAKGGVEVEQFVDLTPVRVEAETPTFQPLAHLITELEIGITDRLEAGLYWAFNQTPGEQGRFSFDGILERIRYRLADPGAWPVDVALYFELQQAPDAFEVEGKVLLQRRVGAVTVMVNLWAEREFFWKGGGVWVLNPTGGFTWQVRPWLHLGLEYWGHVELDAGAPGFDEAFHHFLGPAVMLQVGKVWWSFAPYLRLDGFDRGAQVGDSYGRVWVRSVVGVDI
jgi:hypothetical protein